MPPGGRGRGPPELHASHAERDYRQALTAPELYARLAGRARPFDGHRRLIWDARDVTALTTTNAQIIWQSGASLRTSMAQ